MHAKVTKHNNSKKYAIFIWIQKDETWKNTINLILLTKEARQKKDPSSINNNIPNHPNAGDSIKRVIHVKKHILLSICW